MPRYRHGSVFVKVGQDVRVEGDTLTEAINKGVSLGYTDGYLRKSVVSPIHRVNTQDNTPAVFIMIWLREIKLR